MTRLKHMHKDLDWSHGQINKPKKQTCLRATDDTLTAILDLKKKSQPFKKKHVIKQM